MKANALNLSFNCTCWQNRKARIYMNGSDFASVVEQTLRKRTDNGTTCIVLSRSKSVPNPTPLTLPDGSSGFFFTDGGLSAFHCEWQVWKKSKTGSLSLFLDPDVESNEKESNEALNHSQTQGDVVESVVSESVSTLAETEEDNVSNGSGPSFSLEDHIPDTSPASGDVKRGVSSESSPVVVERALRSRVAYSERPTKNSVHSVPREDSIRMAPIAMCNDRVYCTIDCMKGLKVQALSIICIIRIGMRIFASTHTSFPPPSSLKRKERSRIAKPKRSSPFKKMAEFDDDLDDLMDLEESPELRALHHASSMDSFALGPEKVKASRQTTPETQISGETLFMDVHANQFAPHSNSHRNTSPLNYLNTNGSVKSENSAQNDTCSWPAPNLASVASTTSASPHTTQGVTSFLPSFSPIAPPNEIPNQAQQKTNFHSSQESNNMMFGMVGNGMAHGMVHGVSNGMAPNGAWITVLNRLKAIATAYAESVLSSILRVAYLQSALTNMPNTAALHQLALWGLSGSIALEGKLVSGLLDIFALPSFIGTIDNARAYDLLSTHLSPQEAGIFIVRISQADPRWLEIYGVFRDSNPPNTNINVLEEYCATIMYHQPDPRQPAELWIDTDGNAQDSRSEHITALISYISKITGWQAFDRERLEIIPPQLSVPTPSMNTMTSAADSSPTSSSSLSRTPIQQQNHIFSIPSSSNFNNSSNNGSHLNQPSSYSSYSNGPWYSSTSSSSSTMPSSSATPWYELSPTADDPFHPFMSASASKPHQPSHQQSSHFDPSPFVAYHGIEQ